MQATMVFAKPSARPVAIIPGETSIMRGAIAARQPSRTGETPIPGRERMMREKPVGAKVGMQHIGRICGVDLDIETWDPVSAEADLAVCGMFRREMPGTALSGGLRHLDGVLKGGLVALRKDGIFKGAQGETLLLSHPPRPILACGVLLVGLGDPMRWDGDMARHVAAVATGEVLRLRVGTVAFAPGLLDSGFQEAAIAATAGALLEGVMGALEAAGPALIDPDTGRPSLRRWIFDAGHSHAAQVAATFQAAFKSHRG